MKFPEFTCIFHALTGLYCPGCGGTRSMYALLHGHILLAVHENPASPLIVAIFTLWITELIFARFDKKIKLFPRSGKFWTTMLIFWLIWAVLRNFIPILQPFT